MSKYDRNIEYCKLQQCDKVEALILKQAGGYMANDRVYRSAKPVEVSKEYHVACCKVSASVADGLKTKS